MILAIIMCMSIGFYNLAILIASSHDMYGIDANYFPVAKPYPRSTYIPCLHINIACGGRKSRSFSRTRRKKLVGWV